jgi:hypothetical protein
MRNGTTNWDGLDDGFGVGDDEDVEYVGVIEEESAVPMGSNGVSGARRVRSTVRPEPSPYMRRRRIAQPAPEPVTESLRVATASGAVTLNSDAVKAASHSPLQRMGDHAVRRAAPGTYLVMRPMQAETLHGLGTNGDWAAYLPPSMTGGGETTTRSSSGGGFDVGGLIGGLLETGAGITGSVLEYQSGREERRAEAEARRIAAETALEESRQRRMSEREQAQREFELQMERIRALREAGQEGAARELEERLPAVPPAGPSPVVWVLVALLGAGALGAVVWGVTRKGDKD